MKLGTKSLLPLLIAAFIGGISAQFLLPQKVITKTVEIQGKTKIVYKDRVVDRTTITTTKPDGTKVVVEKDVTKDTDKLTAVETRISEKLKIVDSRQLTYGVTVLAQPKGLNLESFNYGIQVEYRVFGPFWLSAHMYSNLSGGVGLGFKF
jgi:hypothetical protein